MESFTHATPSSPAQELHAAMLAEARADLAERMAGEKVQSAAKAVQEALGEDVGDATFAEVVDVVAAR